MYTYIWDALEELCLLLKIIIKIIYDLNSLIAKCNYISEINCLICLFTVYNIQIEIQFFSLIFNSIKITVEELR